MEIYKNQGVPRDSYYFRNIARCLKALGKYDEAYELYIKALNLNPKCGNSHYYYGDFLYCQGRYKEAEAHFREALKIKSQDCKSNMDMIIYLFSLV